MGGEVCAATIPSQSAGMFLTSVGIAFLAFTCAYIFSSIFALYKFILVFPHLAKHFSYVSSQRGHHQVPLEKISPEAWM